MPLTTNSKSTHPPLQPIVVAIVKRWSLLNRHSLTVPHEKKIKKPKLIAIPGHFQILLLLFFILLSKTVDSTRSHLDGNLIARLISKSDQTFLMVDINKCPQYPRNYLPITRST